MPATDWINVCASVFSAVGTVGAFSVGFVLLRREHQREEEHAEEERRSQAAKVSAWVEAEPNRKGGMELNSHIHNASDMPIYDVSIPIPSASGSSHDSEFIGMVPPGRTVKRSTPPRNGSSHTSPQNPSRSSSSTAPAGIGPAMSKGCC